MRKNHAWENFQEDDPQQRLWLKISSKNNELLEHAGTVLTV